MLPEEILHYVFQFADPFDISALRSVSNLFRCVSKEFPNVREYTLGKFKTVEQWTLLKVAIEFCRVDAIDKIEYRSTISRAQWKWVVEHAAKCGRLEIIKHAEAKCRMHKHYWNRALFRAARHKRKRVTEYCINKGADDFHAAAQGAVIAGDMESIKRFVKRRKTKITVRSEDWWPCAKKAAQKGNLNALQYIEEQTVMLWPDWRYLTIRAARSGDIKTYQYCKNKCGRAIDDDLIEAIKSGNILLIRQIYKELRKPALWSIHLYAASCSGKLNVLQYIENRLHRICETAWGRVMTYACKKGTSSIISYCVRDKKVCKAYYFYRAMTKSAKYGHPKLTEYFIQKYMSESRDLDMIEDKLKTAMSVAKNKAVRSVIQTWLSKV